MAGTGEIIGGAIQGGVGILGMIAGGIGSAVERNKKEQERKKMLIRSNENYMRDYYKDYTKTADAQAMITKTRQIYKDQFKRRADSSAVTGATDAGVAADKAMANAQVADNISSIAAMGEAKRDRAQGALDNAYNIDSQGKLSEADASMQQWGQVAQSGFNNLAQSGATFGGVGGK